jgi:DNA-binding NarL/FixJ family response regulator
VKKIRLLLVDDQVMFREAIRTLLSLRREFEIVGEADDGLAAVNLAASVRPDVVLMDLRMPRLDGVEATRRIKQAHASIRIIVLTTFEEDAEVFAALRAGAVGYLLKASPAAKLSEAILATMRDESILEPSVAAKLVAEFSRLSAHTPPPPVIAPLSEPLSTRETEVLRCLAAGLSNKEIGRQLHIAEGTVKNHMSQVLVKLGVLDRTQAALRARALGLW